MKQQQGMSFIGFILVAIVVSAIALILFKSIPTYNQYFSIKSTISRLAKDGVGSTPAAIRESFSKSAEIAYIEDVSANDLIVIANGSMVQISVDYEKVVPLVSNVSLLFSFSINETSGKAIGN